MKREKELTNSEKIDKALVDFVNADGLDGEEMWNRKRAVEAFGRITDNVMRRPDDE